MIPNIWGQSEGYIYIQLRDFKSGARNAPEDAAMRGFVATMSDADMLEMAKYASTQPWPKVEPISTDAALLKKGAYATAMVGCGGCHFNDWKGFSANPRIGDQSTRLSRAHDAPVPQRLARQFTGHVRSGAYAR